MPRHRFFERLNPLFQLRTLACLGAVFMNRNLRKFARANLFRPPEVISAPPGSVPHRAGQAHFRFDLGRSLQMHRRLAIGFAVGGLIFAAAYLVGYWPVYPAQSLVSGVIPNALVLFLGFVFLGLAAAVIAQKMDQKIYIASDLEQLLGFAPMAQLPDFLEVPGEVADEQLLRLAAGIEYACKEGGMRSCIFTGAGPEAGVTTVVTRVREMLESMGRPTVLVSASGTAAAETHGRNDRTQSAARSTALLEQAVEEAEIGHESLVMTDAAPLAASAETEYLARFADCTIVVVESGVTTRARVRDMASRLRHLNVAGVGFVLNRVALAKADPAFRHSVEATERHLRMQRRFEPRPAPGGRLVSTEPVRSTGELAAPAAADVTPEQPRMAERTAAPDETKVTAESASIAQLRPVAALPAPVEPAKKKFETIASAAPVLLQALQKYEPIAAASVSRQRPDSIAAQPVLPAARPAQGSPAAPAPDIPPRLTEAPADGTALQRLVNALASQTRAASRETELAAEDGKEAAAAAEETARATPSRLSSLRGLSFALGPKEEKHSAPEAGETEIAPAPRPERAVAVEDLAPLPPPPEQMVPAQTFVAFPEPEPAVASDSANRSRKDSTRRATAEPEFPPSKPLDPARRDRSEAFDDVQILPSWRGQYKRRN